MSDNVSVDNGTGTDFTVSTDEGTGGHVQRVKLAYSADGSETHVSADADGLLVNLGANNDVTNAGTFAVQVDSMPAADQTTDSISAALQTNAIMNDLTALTPKFKSTSVAASQTDSSIIAAVTSKKLRILSAFLQCGGTATDITFESDDASADTQVWKATMGANGGAVLPFNPVGWFETDAGEALIATTGTGSTVQITLVYVEI